MDLLEQINATRSAPTEDEVLAYRMNTVNLAKVRKVRKETEKKPPSIGLSHRLFKTGELKPEERLKRAYRNGRISLSKMALLLAACKKSEQYDSSKIENMASAMGVNAGPIENAFRVEEVFAKADEGWNPISWLEF